MPLVRHVAALLEALRREDLEVMAPAERRRFADLLRHRAAEVDRAGQGEAPRAGVVARFRNGEHAQ
jgi:hypothetical protein